MVRALMGWGREVGFRRVERRRWATVVVLVLELGGEEEGRYQILRIGNGDELSSCTMSSDQKSVSCTLLLNRSKQPRSDPNAPQSSRQHLSSPVHS